MTGQVSNYNRLPLGLKERRQWLLARPDSKGDKKVPTTINAKGELADGSSTNRDTWMDFNAAVLAAEEHNLGIGYVCSSDDPFTCIDLDVKNEFNLPGHPEKWTPQADIDRYGQIIATFNSYTERSVSGQGVHIWVVGKIGAGARKGGVEVYSQERFIVCTGDAVIDKEIVPQQEWLNQLVAEIRRNDSKVDELVELDEELEDMEVIDRLMFAVNGEKFNDLCKGDWAAMGYPSQSEADLALMSMFCFHSKSNAQCRRLFRMTGLGKREKSVKNDKYLNFTLKIIRGRQEREEAAETHGAAIAAALMAGVNVPTPNLQTPQPHTNIAPNPPLIENDCGIADSPVGELPWPPGRMGRIAYHIFQCAPRPVKEVGIIAALGFVAGIAGRIYQLPQSGLNVYLVLVARSAVGKEAMHSGISRIINECVGETPGIINYVSYSEFASGPALVKAVAEQQCFVNVAGEWGRKLRRLSMEEGRDGPMQQLRTVMTNLYQKSSIDSIVGGLGYSDKDKSVASVSGVAYSMIGETTPGTFYDSLTETMMEDGFLSRFTIIEYSGDRPPLNHTPAPALPEEIKWLFHQLVTTAGHNIPIYLKRNSEAAEILRVFDLECDKQINSTLDEGWRQMWNRAHLKVLRIAGLLAVADNPVIPVVDATHVSWALDLIKRDIAVMARRIAGGDIGMGDAPRERKLLSCVAEYMKETLLASYKIPDALHKAGIIPRSYLQVRVVRTTAFTTHRNGATYALDSTIKSLMDSGYLQEVDRAKLIELYGFHGRAYRIVSIPRQPKG